MPGKIIDLPTVAGPGERAPYTPIGGDDRALHTNLTIQRFFFFFHFFFFFFSFATSPRFSSLFPSLLFSGRATMHRVQFVPPAGLPTTRTSRWTARLVTLRRINEAFECKLVSWKAAKDSLRNDQFLYFVFFLFPVCPWTEFQTGFSKIGKWNFEPGGTEAAKLFNFRGGGWNDDVCFLNGERCW